MNSYSISSTEQVFNEAIHPYQPEALKKSSNDYMLNLFLQEKYFIIFRKDLSSLKKRNQLARACRYRNRFTRKFFQIP